MDSVTHTLFGLTLYGAVDKKDMSTNMKRALLLTTVVGSQLPDIDVVSPYCPLWEI
ncbi:metal-dependent hydrolase [Anaerobacillus sp. MEB173]|uniref:metal-dependent hydrolase n=1 Tax=Anaerobacillus sp. MEB173 TaxID=3383345 RepID=UPI003F8F50E3